MTWTADAPYRPEVQKCRINLLRYCTGIGLDIGCGPEKIRPEAIGVDQDGKGDINCNLTQGLTIFKDEVFDYVFSSHCLEDFEFTEAILEDWWRLVKVGGHLVLYLPHKDYYPNIGQPGSNPAHRHDFIPDDIINIMKGLGSWDLVRNETHSENDEYSFELVFRKTISKHITLPTYIQKRDDRPKALVIRYGAYGDHIIATPLLRVLHEQGYHVTYNCTSRAYPVIANNPHIDYVMEQEPNLIPPAALDEYWADISRGYDKVINLSETLECKFLFVPDRPGYHDQVEVRRNKSGNTNYYDYVLEHSGFSGIIKPRPELFPTKVEEAMGQYFRAKHAGKFVILWALAGSSLHKAYPFGEQVALEFLNRHSDAITITVGDDLCRLVEWDHPRAEKKSSVWDIRSSMLATNFVDLVISPETGILNAAGCYTTPKIGLLTHSNKTNLTKYFPNDYSMQAEIDCSPCHRMIYPHNAEKDCPKMDLGGGHWLCACAGAFDPDKLLKRMETIYATWKAKKNTVRLIRPEQAVHAFDRLTMGQVFQPKRVAV